MCVCVLSARVCSGFFAWRDDAGVSLSKPGKPDALFALSKWFAWLAESDGEEEEGEGEEEEEEEDYMADVIKPDNSKVMM